LKSHRESSNATQEESGEIFRDVLSDSSEDINNEN
jgi:hypothetical protein